MLIFGLVLLVKRFFEGGEVRAWGLLILSEVCPVCWVGFLFGGWEGKLRVFYVDLFLWGFFCCITSD